MRQIRLTLLLAVLLLPTILSAQSGQFKNERRIYLWDVTLSMKGYNDKTPDIYDDVVRALSNDINSIIDEQTEIIVLPFQTKILDVISAKATKEGREEITRKIKAFNSEDVTYTNICKPLSDVMSSYIADQRRNVLILMTDGEQNDPGTSEEDLLELIRKWCAFATKNDAYAFYVMLTEHAQNDALSEVIRNTCRISNIIVDKDGEINLNFIELLTQEEVSFNIKDDAEREVRLSVSSKKRVTIPEDVEIQIMCSDNPYITLDQSSGIKDGVIMLDIDLKQSYEELKMALPTDRSVRINARMKIKNSEEYPLTQLLNENFTICLINKPEKTLELYVKD